MFFLPVNDPFGVNVMQAQDELHDDALGGLFLQWFLVLCQILLHIPSIAILQNDVQMVVVKERVT